MREYRVGPPELVAQGAAAAERRPMREVVILTLACGIILIMAAAIAVHFVLQ